MNKARILTVDDDPNLQIVMEQYLDSDGYDVSKANNVQTALETVAGANFDVILLDLGLPDGEGLNLIPQLRSQTQAPIIIVSGKSDTIDKVVCLEMGADDYLTKPFEMRELAARIKVVLRRGQVSNDLEAATVTIKNAEKIAVDYGTMDKGQYQVFDHQGNPLSLTTGEFQLLEALVTANKRALSREQLFSLTREGEYDVYDRAIDIQIARIRKKTGDESGDILKTVRGVGYMYVGKAEII